jgi:hypothetical protein
MAGRWLRNNRKRIKGYEGQQGTDDHSEAVSVYGQILAGDVKVLHAIV